MCEAFKLDLSENWDGRVPPVTSPRPCLGVHIIVSKRNVSKQLLSNQNHAEPVGDMLLKSRR